MRQLRFVTSTLLMLMLAGAAPVWSQAYPNKPIRLVIPYPPGGVDVIVRIAQAQAEKELGQPLVVDYRPGAGGQIGQEYTARSAADGYTLLATVTNPWINLPLLRKSTPYDPIKDFTPITMLVEGGNLLVSVPSFGPNNLRELLAYAKSNPGKVSYATSGIGGAQHLDAENISRMTGLPLLHVPFQGFGPMIPALLSGQVSVGFINLNAVSGMVKAGKLKVLGSIDKTRPAALPGDVQMMGDVVPGFIGMPAWVAIAGPAGLPRPVVNRVNEAFIKALNAPEVRARNLADGFDIIAAGPDEFAVRLKTGFEQLRSAIQAAGIPPLD